MNYSRQSNASSSFNEAPEVQGLDRDSLLATAEAEVERTAQDQETTSPVHTTETRPRTHLGRGRWWTAATSQCLRTWSQQERTAETGLAHTPRSHRLFPRSLPITLRRIWGKPRFLLLLPCPEWPSSRPMQTDLRQSRACLHPLVFQTTASVLTELLSQTSVVQWILHAKLLELK